MIENILLYNDYSWIWPLWGELSDYEEESNFTAELIKKHSKIEVKSILDVSCGGGKNSYYLKKHFDLTGIDLSEEMLKHAKKLNPECQFIKADMRSFNLDKKFDSIFINDGIFYLHDEQDQLSLFQTCYNHLNKGGVLITYVEHSKENFEQNTSSVFKIKKDDTYITILENSFDTNVNDTKMETTLIYIIHKINVPTKIATDIHTGGIFPLSTWEKNLQNAGFSFTKSNKELEGKIYPFFVANK